MRGISILLLLCAAGALAAEQDLVGTWSGKAHDCTFTWTVHQIRGKFNVSFECTRDGTKVGHGHGVQPTFADGVISFKCMYVQKPSAAYANGPATLALKDGKLVFEQTDDKHPLRVEMDKGEAVARVPDKPAPDKTSTSPQKTSKSPHPDTGTDTASSNKVIKTEHTVPIKLPKDMPPATPVQTYAFDKKVIAIALSPDGKWLAGGHEGAGVAVVDTANGKTVWKKDTLAKHYTARVSSLSISSDNKTLIVVLFSFDHDAQNIFLFDVATGQPKQGSMSKHLETPIAVFHPNKPNLVAVITKFQNGFAVMDVNTGKPVFEHEKAYVSPIVSMSFSPDGKQIVTSGDDNNKGHAVRVWDSAKGTLDKEVFAIKEIIASPTYSTDGKTLVAYISKFGKPSIIAWNTTDWSESRRIEELPDGIFRMERILRVVPDNKTLAAACRDSAIHFFDLASGEHTAALKAVFPGVVETMLLSPDGKLVVANNDAKEVRVFAIPEH